MPVLARTAPGQMQVVRFCTIHPEYRVGSSGRMPPLPTYQWCRCSGQGAGPAPASGSGRKTCSFLAVRAYWYERRYDGSTSTGARPEIAAVFRLGHTRAMRQPGSGPVPGGTLPDIGRQRTICASILSVAQIRSFLGVPPSHPAAV